MRYQTSQSEEIIGTHRFRLSRLSSFEGAVDEMYRELESAGRREDLETLCPYFGVLWPGARVLARWIAEEIGGRVAGRRFLELGCGLALPSLLAARLGADVTASDLHPDVPYFLAANLALNRPTRVGFRRVDWRAPLGCRAGWDWIVASDVLYERGQAAPLLDFFARALAPGGEAIVLDPNRSYWEDLLSLAGGAGLAPRAQYLAPRDEGDPPLSVLIRLKPL